MELKQYINILKDYMKENNIDSLDVDIGLYVNLGEVIIDSNSPNRCRFKIVNSELVRQKGNK